MDPNEALATLRAWLRQNSPETALEELALEAFASLDATLSVGNSLPDEWDSAINRY